MMKHTIDDLTLEEVNLLALAVDFFLCNYEHQAENLDIIEDLFMHLDISAEEAEEAEGSTARVVDRTDNVLVVDFSPKSI